MLREGTPDPANLKINNRLLREVSNEQQIFRQASVQHIEQGSTIVEDGHLHVPDFNAQAALHHSDT